MSLELYFIHGIRFASPIILYNFFLPNQILSQRVVAYQLSKLRSKALEVERYTGEIYHGEECDTSQYREKSIESQPGINILTLQLCSSTLVPILGYLQTVLELFIKKPLICRNFYVKTVDYRTFLERVSIYINT